MWNPTNAISTAPQQPLSSSKEKQDFQGELVATTGIPYQFSLLP
jgi:hypothetical protein